jgi:hypothetical protein
MNRHSSILLAVWILIAGTSPAQVFTPPAPTGAGSSTGGNNTTIVNQEPAQGQRQVVGNDLPYLDPATNVFQFDGKSFHVQDNQVFRSRFEKYLNAKESSEDLAYRKAMRDILDALAPHGERSLPRAVALLQLASSYPQDALLCESIANAVYRIWLSRKSSYDLTQINQQLNKERERLDWNYERQMDVSSLEAGGQEATKDAKAQKEAQAQLGKAGRVARYVQRIAEIEADRVANRAKMELSEIESKIEFQALIVQLFLQRRFEHVIMSSRLYTEFFQDGSGRLEYKEGSDVEKMFSKSIGFNPTITTLDTFSNEAIRDIAQQIEAYELLMKQGELDGATRQLQQAFITGEYLPSVQSVPLEEKRRILEYARNGFQLVNAMEVKDFALAEKLVAKMREQASDFDHSKPTAAIEGAKLASMMRIRTAKNAALSGDNAAYEENIKEAARIWPSNPMLQEQFNLLADSADIQQQAKIEFDRLLSTQSYRQIYNDKAKFIAATVEDEERQSALNQIVGNILEIETAMNQADSLGKSGNNYAAWELIEKAFKKFPDDVPLSAKRSDLSTEVAEFVRALKTAENLEKRNQTGSSLAWFLQSREMYPQSQFASEGIERLVDRILPDTPGQEGGSGEAGAGSGGQDGSAPVEAPLFDSE